MRLDIYNFIALTSLFQKQFQLGNYDYNGYCEWLPDFKYVEP